MHSSFEGELSISTKNGEVTISLVTDSNEEITVKNVTLIPFGYEETYLLNGKDNDERLLPLKVESDDKSNIESIFRKIDATVELKSLNITTRWSLKLIAITEGGWLPAGISTEKAHYLLDKNVFNILNVRYINGDLKENVENDFFDLIASKNLILNPSLFMLEGNSRSFDRTSEELGKKYYEAVSKIKNTLPNAVLPSDHQSLISSILGMLAQLYNDNENKLSFIHSVIPILYKETAIKKRKDTIKIIKDLANSIGIRRDSILFVATLSAALSDSKNNPAKRIFKPKPQDRYTLEDSYNTLSDFRALDYLMWAIAMDPKMKTYLCTNDKNLVKFWCAIEPHNFKFQENRLSHNLRFQKNLFNNLSSEEYEWVIEAIQ